MLTKNLLKEVIIARLHWLRNITTFNSKMGVDDFMIANPAIIRNIKKSIEADYNIDMAMYTPELRDGITLYLKAEGIYKE